jgi:lantibiotic biosynthesis protein
MGWQPILDGELAAEALRIVREICAELNEGEPGNPDAAELALLWGHVAAAIETDEIQARYEAASARLFEGLERGIDSLGLHGGGLAGAAWVITALGADAEEFLDAVDHTLFEAVSSNAVRPYDLISGTVGFGVYLLERPTTMARAALARIVAQLDERATHVDDGITWLTSAAVSSEAKRARFPDGHYDCGVAHGVSGVIALLARIAALPDPPPRAITLYREGMRWLRARDLGSDPRGHFPAFVIPGLGPSPRGGTAWCYGDLGIATVLWGACARGGDTDAEWRDIAAECARRSPDQCGVKDAAVCHGAAGMGHLLNRCYQTSRDPSYRDAARAWLMRALAMREPGQGIAGFRTLVHRGDVETFAAERGLLDGVTGIVLALLAGVAREEPAWDRLLLCDIPTAP